MDGLLFRRKTDRKRRNGNLDTLNIKSIHIERKINEIV